MPSDARTRGPNTLTSTMRRARSRAHDDAADLQPRARQRQLEHRLIGLTEADQEDADGSIAHERDHTRFTVGPTDPQTAAEPRGAMGPCAGTTLCRSSLVTARASASTSGNVATTS